jgi:hydrogenase maturation factor HypF (carbamoyltransferase family)
MATSTCPKCTSTSFEIKTNEPKGSRYKIHFIQCSSCGAVVGTMEYYDTANLLDKIGKKLGIDIYQ